MSRRKGQRPGQCVPRHAPTAVGGDKMVAGGGTRKGHRRGRSDGKHTFVGLRCTTHLRSVAAGSDGGCVCCTCSYDHCYRRGRRKREKSDETAAVTQPDAILLVGRVIKYPTRLVGAARLDLPRRPTCTHERDRPAAGWALVRHGTTAVDEENGRSGDGYRQEALHRYFRLILCLPVDV
jgi:hypothetical protein